jgi:hypothetical protein
MLDVEGSSLQRLVHTTIFTAPRGPGLDRPRYIPLGHHGGVRPSK